MKDNKKIKRRIKKPKQEAENRPRDADLLYRTLFNQSPDGILIIDTRGRFIDFNEAAHRQLGYTREEFGKLRLSDIDPFQRPEEIQASIKKVLEKGSDELDVKHKTKAGAIRDVHVITRLLVLSGRTVFHTIWRDVTERTRAEEALRASGNFLQTIIETEPECVKLLDADGTLIMMNRAGLTMIEAESVDQVQGKSAYPLVAAEYREAFKKLVESTFQGKNGTLEFDMVGLGGRRLRLQTHSVPLRNENNEIIAALGVTRDITERKKLEEDLIRAQKLESIGLLAGGIAHDFNNLLTAILGNISLTKMYLNNTEKASARLAEAEHASLRAKDLTRQLLTFAKGGAPVKKTASIGPLVQESARFALRGSNVKCEVTAPRDLWPVEIDEGQMSQVINNLVINADQAMPAGGTIKIDCSNVEIGEESVVPLKAGKYVKISIEDTGIGISQEHLSKIFDPYFTTKQRGSGLGLATTYSIIKRHDGQITVESRLDVGTTFHIYLPASEMGHILKKADDESLVKGTGKILVMDDEDAVRSVAAEMLRGLGYEVEVARDGAEAIAAYTRAKDSGHAFHAVIMDLTVPGGMGGEEAVKKLLEIDSHIKAIVSSGYSNDLVIADYKKYGFGGVIAKPYTVANLGEAVAKVMKLRS